MSETNGTATKPKDDEVVRCNFFVNHPQELLDKYAGKDVAWSFDGRYAPSLRNTRPRIR